MEMGKNNMYGWGICQIPMPRTGIDIYADRRKGQAPMAFSDRRSQRLLQPFTSILATSLRRDFPLLQTGFIALASVLLLLIIGFYPRPVSLPEELPVVQPVEIVTRILEEPKIETPVPAEVVVAETVPEPLPEAIKPPVPTPPKPREIPVPPTMVSLAPAKPQPLKAPKEVIRPVERPAPLPQKTVALTVPARQAPLPAPPAPPRQEQNFSLATPQQRPLLADREVPARSTTETRLAAPRVSASADYSLDAAATRQPALAQGKQQLATAPGTTVDLPTSTTISSDFSVPRSQGGHSVARAGRSFAPEPGAAPGAISSASRVAGSYAASSSDAGAPLTSGEVVAFAGSVAATAVALPDAPGQGVTTGGASVTDSSTGSGPPDTAVKFIGDGDGTTDPDLFVSLNQLGACVDQAEEDRLRTELAIQLDKGGVFPCGSMRFYIDYVETGQTVQMRIYNPRDFADKCAALLSAIECVNQSE